MSARSTRCARQLLSALLFLDLAACQGDQKQPTYGLMLGIRTNLEVTKDVDSVRVAIWQGGGFGGRPVYDWEYALDRGHALPATLAIVSLDNQSPQEAIQVTVQGKRNGLARTIQEFTTLLPPYDSSVHELGGSPVDSRRQFLPAPDSGGAPDEMTNVGEITGLRFLDSSIDWLCANSDADGDSDDGFECSDDKTCVAGYCVDKHLELSDLPPYRGEQAAGGQGGQMSAGCFEVADCFAGAKLVTPTVGDMGQCELDTSVDSNINFAIALPTANDGFCDESHCYVPLDHDVTTGWIETATGVQLPQRVCDRTGRDPSNVQVAISRRCESKTRSQAPCQPTNNGGAGGGVGGGVGGGGDGGNSQGGSEPAAPTGGTGGAPVGTNQPIVSDTSPSKDATDVDPYATIRVTFSKPLDATSIDEKSFRVLDGSSSVPGTVTYAPGKTVAVFSPAKPLALLAHYVVELDASIRDENGLALRNAFSFEFSVRDGTWGKPIDVGSADAAPLELAGGDSGEAMLLWSQDGFIQSQHFANDAWTSIPALSSAPKGTNQAALAWQDGVGVYGALAGTQDVAFFHFDGASWSAAGDLSLTIADRISFAQRDGDVRALLQVGGSLSTYKYSGSAFAGQVKVVDAGPPNPALLAAALVLDKAHNVLVYWSGKTNKVEAMVRTPSDESSGSVTWGNAADVSPYTAGLNDLHAFVDEKGHFTVIWAAGSGWDMLDSVFAAESDDGVKWSAPTTLVSTQVCGSSCSVSGTLSNLRVVQRGQAGLLAVYQETTSGTAQMRSLARAGSAAKFGQPVTIAQDGGLPAVALDPHGNALVFFQGKGSPQMVRYQAATNVWSNSDTTMHDVKLIVDGYGRATAAWLDASGAPPGKQMLKLARFY